MCPKSWFAELSNMVTSVPQCTPNEKCTPMYPNGLQMGYNVPKSKLEATDWLTCWLLTFLHANMLTDWLTCRLVNLLTTCQQVCLLTTCQTWSPLCPNVPQNESVPQCAPKCKCALMCQVAFARLRGSSRSWRWTSNLPRGQSEKQLRGSVASWSSTG